MYKVEYIEQSRTYRKRVSKNKNTLNRNRYIHVKIHIQLIQLLQLIINGCFNQTETSINLIIDASYKLYIRHFKKAKTHYTEKTRTMKWNQA